MVCKFHMSSVIKIINNTCCIFCSKIVLEKTGTQKKVAVFQRLIQKWKVESLEWLCVCTKLYKILWILKISLYHEHISVQSAESSVREMQENEKFDLVLTSRMLSNADKTKFCIYSRHSMDNISVQWSLFHVGCWNLNNNDRFTYLNRIEKNRV